MTHADRHAPTGPVANAMVLAAFFGAMWADVRSPWASARLTGAMIAAALACRAAGGVARLLHRRAKLEREHSCPPSFGHGPDVARRSPNWPIG